MLIQLKINDSAWLDPFFMLVYKTLQSLELYVYALIEMSNENTHIKTKPCLL